MIPPEAVFVLDGIRWPGCRDEQNEGIYPVILYDSETVRSMLAYAHRTLFLFWQAVPIARHRAIGDSIDGLNDLTGLNHAGEDTPEVW